MWKYLNISGFSLMCQIHVSLIDNNRNKKQQQQHKAAEEEKKITYLVFENGWLAFGK